MDPWADKYPYTTPYSFVENNPSNLIDPNGKGPTWWEKTFSKVFSQVQKTIKKITGKDTQKEIEGIMKEIRSGTDETTSDIKDYVDFESLRESEEVQVGGGWSPHHKYYKQAQNDPDKPGFVIGHDRVELVNEVAIFNESNVEISYETNEAGERSVHYSTNGQSARGIIRVTIPAWDPAVTDGGNQRKTGMQLIFNVANEKQWKESTRLNSELGGLYVRPR